MQTVECNCQTCQTNASRLGLTAPLRAQAPEKFVSQAGAHGTVWAAHSPSFLDEIVRRQCSITAL